MTRCAACDGRLARGALFCAACGAARDRATGVGPDIELDGADIADGGTEVRFERRPVGGGRLVTAAVLLVGVVVTGSVALSSGGGGAALGPTTVAISTTERAVSTTEPVVTTSEPDTTTTSPPVVRIGDGPMLGEPTGLSLLVGGSHVAVIDLDRATFTIVETLSRYVVGGQITPVGIAYQGGGGGLSLLAPGSSKPQDIADGGVYLGEGPVGRAWFLLYGQSAGGPQIVHVDAPGASPIVAELPAGVSVAYPDGDGGLVTAAGGGIYRVAPGGAPARIGTGDLLGARDGHALARSCDDGLRCHYVVVDVATGAVRAGPTAPAGSWGDASALLSPDGSWLLEPEDAAPADGRVRRMVARGLDGTTVELGSAVAACFSALCSFGPEWAPTGGWLVWIVDPTTIAAWRPGLDEPRTVKLPADIVNGSYMSVEGLSVASAERLAAYVPVSAARG